jgi:hypothetical protein
MNGKSRFLKDDVDDDDENLSQSTQPPTPVRPSIDPLLKHYKTILLTPGQVVSLSLLISKGKFKRIRVDNETGGAAARRLTETLTSKGLGQLIHCRSVNNTKVNIILHIPLFVRLTIIRATGLFCRRNSNPSNSIPFDNARNIPAIFHLKIIVMNNESIYRILRKLKRTIIVHYGTCNISAD